MRRLYRNIQHLYGETNQLRQQLGSQSSLQHEEIDQGVVEEDQAKLVIQQLRARVRELESSTSWRITAPLRAIKQLFSGRG
jgi:hypothetical protein